MPKGQKLTSEKAIELLSSKHPDIIFPNFSYIDAKHKIDCVCKIDGHAWSAYYSNLIKGTGCPKCAGRPAYSSEEALARLQKIRPSFSFPDFSYRGKRSLVKFFCNDCGYEGEQQYGVLIRGSKCPKCQLGKHKTESDVINILSSIHRFLSFHIERYDNVKSNIQATCLKCNYSWLTNYQNLVYWKCGCPLCNSKSYSRGEDEISQALNDNNIPYFCQYAFDDCKNKIALRFDFFIPSLNMCVEVQGKQHFEPIDYWGGENTLKEIQFRDQIKKKYCQDNNINLVLINNDKVHREHCISISEFIKQITCRR